MERYKQITLTTYTLINYWRRGSCCRFAKDSGRRPRRSPETACGDLWPAGYVSVWVARSDRRGRSVVKSLFGHDGVEGGTAMNFRIEAAMVARAAGVTVRLVRFTTREDLEEIKP